MTPTIGCDKEVSGGGESRGGASDTVIRPAGADSSDVTRRACVMVTRKRDQSDFSIKFVDLILMQLMIH